MATPRDPKLIALLFNEAINQRDLDALVSLITDDHQFIDSAAQVTSGRTAVERAWSGFLSVFPDYQNVFDAVESRDDLVLMRGRSVCSHVELHGPAIWTARIRGDKVAEWRVYEDDTDSRRALGYDPKR